MVLNRTVELGLNEMQLIKNALFEYRARHPELPNVKKYYESAIQKMTDGISSVMVEVSNYVETN